MDDVAEVNDEDLRLYDDEEEEARDRGAQQGIYSVGTENYKAAQASGGLRLPKDIL